VCVCVFITETNKTAGSNLACRAGHLVPIWQPRTGSSFQRWAGANRLTLTLRVSRAGERLQRKLLEWLAGPLAWLAWLQAWRPWHAVTAIDAEAVDALRCSSGAEAGGPVGDAGGGLRNGVHGGGWEPEHFAAEACLGTCGREMVGGDWGAVYGDASGMRYRARRDGHASKGGTGSGPEDTTSVGSAGGEGLAGDENLASFRSVEHNGALETMKTGAEMGRSKGD
jgi:hypothetical protein